MGFRTVVIKSRAKLECRLNYLVVRAEEEKKIFLDEISTLIIQSTAVSLTASLISTLSQSGVNVIFCDEKCNPVSEVLPYYGAHNTSKRYKEQIRWSEAAKAEIWRVIVRRKILGQAQLLKDRGFAVQAEMLENYAAEVAPRDSTNREGHAAKVYFNCILGEGNSRKGGGFLNGCLNYGYTVILSAFNREIVSSGYLTQLGIWHDNEFNEFNLSCDLMEPLRPVVDRVALGIEEGDKEFKRKLADILNYYADIEGKKTTLDIAVRRYVKSFFRAVEEENADWLSFPEKVTKENEL